MGLLNNSSVLVATARQKRFLALLSLARGISEDKQVDSHRLWGRHKRNTQMNGEEGIRDQLLFYCDDDMSEELGNLFGNQLDTKTEEQLLSEMRRLAVIDQNNFLNIVRHRSMVHSRDEPIRSHLARPKGISAVC